MKKQQSHKFWESKLRQKENQIRELENSIEELKNYVKIINKQLLDNKEALLQYQETQNKDLINGSRCPQSNNKHQNSNLVIKSNLKSPEPDKLPRRKHHNIRNQPKKPLGTTTNQNSETAKELILVNSGSNNCNENSELSNTNQNKPTWKHHNHFVFCQPQNNPPNRKHNNKFNQKNPPTSTDYSFQNKPKVLRYSILDNKQNNSKISMMNNNINDNHNQSNNKRKFNSQEEQEQKKVTDYSLGLSIYSTESIESSEIAKYIAVLLMGCKYTKTYNPLKKKHVLQIFAKNELELNNIMFIRE
ncbi:hypothetical protein ABK040_009438 [Willaertia magna]